MNKKFSIFLFFILIIASFLRLWNISHNPAGFFVDEASSGLNAFKILTTGHDVYGKAFPVIFQAAGDYRDPVMIYSTIPSIALFGLTEFAVRVVSSIYGIAAVIMIYFVGKEYINEKVGLWSALLLAISPWHVHFSRVGFQLIAAVFWLLFALYFLKKSSKHIYFYFLAVVGFILTFFSYSATKLYLPFLLLFFVFSYPHVFFQLTKKKYVWVISLMAILLVTYLIYPYVEDGTFFKRWTQVNKQLSIIEVGQAYLNHFSPQFLFITGDAQFPGQDVLRHSFLGVGELYWFQLPFLLVSLITFLYSKKNRQQLLFFFLFLYLYPLGSIFTAVEPQATRSILGVIPFTILTAYGIELVHGFFKTSVFRNMFYTSFVTGILISLFLLVVAISNYPIQSAGYLGWQYGYRPAIKYLKKHEFKYEQLLITHRYNSGIELLHFYNEEYHCSNCSIISNPITIDTTKRQLFALRLDDIKEASNLYPNLEFKQKATIRLPNGNTELYIGEFVANNSSS